MVDDPSVGDGAELGMEHELDRARVRARHREPGCIPAREQLLVAEAALGQPLTSLRIVRLAVFVPSSHSRPDLVHDPGPAP
jgi:hypothetical protein